MVKTSRVIVLVVAFALLAVSAFAATPVAQPQLPGAAAPAPMVSTTLVAEIFSPTPGAQPAAAFLTRGVCNLTCLPCDRTCPDFHGGHQSCVSICP
jgi:hypothetical protein